MTWKTPELGPEYSVTFGIDIESFDLWYLYRSLRYLGTRYSLTLGVDIDPVSSRKISVYEIEASSSHHSHGARISLNEYVRESRAICRSV